MKKIDNNSKLFNFSIFSKPKIELLKILKKQLEQQSQLTIIFTPNPEQIMLAKRDPDFASYLGLADILIPDGAGLVTASKLISFFSGSTPIYERITGTDLAMNLISLAGEENLPVLLIGGRGYEVSESKIPEAAILEVSGTNIYWLPGYKSISDPSEQEEKVIRAAIAKIQPAIVFAAFGAPHQEKWVLEHRSHLEKNNTTVVLAVGGAFDMITGKIKRAPRLMQKWGLEWLFRLVREPWRARRQLQLIPFIGLTLHAAAKQLLSQKN